VEAMSMLDAVKKLRFKTSAGMMECKAALKEADGDIEKAVEVLRKKGIAKLVILVIHNKRYSFVFFNIL